MSLEQAIRIADAVLLEGYLLYPYRTTSTKNQYRWTFGVLAPRAWSERGGCEAWWQEAQALLAGNPSSLRIQLRFLAIVDRRVERRDGDELTPVAELTSEGELYVACEEGELCTVEISGLEDGAHPFTVLAEKRVVSVPGGRIVYARPILRGTLRVKHELLAQPPAEEPLYRLSIRIENHTMGVPSEAPRGLAMRWSFASTHLLVATEGARFISLLDPPPHAREAAAQCRGTRMWTVLSGDDGRDDVAIASTLILSDYPEIAPESPGDFCDACEIDEMLALRTRTLTPEEKRLVRATDPRGRAILERSESLTEEDLARLHGTRRAAYVPGTRVRLRPHARRSDAQDLLFAGRTATIRAVKKAVDGRELFAVTIDDDPAAELHAARATFRHYYRDELEAL